MDRVFATENLIQQIAMYDQQNFQYDVELYQPCQELSFSLSDLPYGFFNVEPQKPEQPTEHTGKEQVQQIQNASQNSEVLPSLNKFSQEIDKNQRIIEFSNAQLFRMKRLKNGRPKEIKNINQIFKTETLFYLNMLIEFKILSEQEKSWVQNFKQESVSAASFSKLMEKQFIKKKLKEFYTSTELVKRILNTQRLSFSRKIEVIKYINLCVKYIELEPKQLAQ